MLQFSGMCVCSCVYVEDENSSVLSTATELSWQIINKACTSERGLSDAAQLNVRSSAAGLFTTCNYQVYMIRAHRAFNKSVPNGHVYGRERGPTVQRENRDFIQGRARHITMRPTLASRPGPSLVFVFTHEKRHRKLSQGVSLGCIG